MSVVVAEMDPARSGVTPEASDRQLVATVASGLRYRIMNLLGFRVPKHLLLLPIMLVLACEGVSPVTAQRTPTSGGYPRGEWVRVGPPADLSISSFSISPDWPSDRLILVQGIDDRSQRISGPSGDMVVADPFRTIDGGNTWERLEARSAGVGRVAIAPPGPNGRMIFGAGAWNIERPTFEIARSLDAGSTWQAVHSLSVARVTDNAFHLSPSFVSDGNAFATHDGALYRSNDYGGTWTTIHPSGDQRVQQVALSPNFATDRTVVAAVVTGEFPAPWNWRTNLRSATYNVSSAGVVVSNDGGDTWRVSSTGMEIGGTPYRHVRSIAISPTFGKDGTLFAFAWGPSDGPAIPAGLFRSTDRGQSWANVWHSDPAKDGMRWSGTFAPSPAFGSDNVGQLAVSGVSTLNISPHSTPVCVTYATGDGGQSWSLVPRQSARDPGCTALKMTSGGPNGRTLFSLRYPGEGRAASAYRSFDDGATWSSFGPPTYLNIGTGYWPYHIANDGTFFVGTYESLWALGPSAGLASNVPATPTEAPDTDR